MTSNVVKIVNDDVGVDEALDDVKALGLTEVFIVGTNSTGDIMTRSSRMDRKTALWLLEVAKTWVIGD